MNEPAGGKIIYDEIPFDPPQGVAVRIAGHLHDGRQILGFTQIIRPPRLAGQMPSIHWAIVAYQPAPTGPSVEADSQKEADLGATMLAPL